MSTNNSFSHLTLEERRIILTGITNGSSKNAIAQTIGKDKSTVGKEIKLHQSLTQINRTTGNNNTFNFSYIFKHVKPP